MTDASRCRYNLDTRCPDLAPTLAVASVLTEGRCLADVTLNNDDHRLAICVLPKGHLTPHGDLMGTTWTDEDHWRPDHTHAIVEAAREWVAAHDALVAAATFGADDSLQFAAERKSVAALIAAVDAERAEFAKRGGEVDRG